MAYEILMPKLSSTMDTGTITTWLKNVGERIEVGEVIFEVMTDKIAIEVESYEEGFLLKKYIDDGESAPVNSIIGYIGEEDEEVPETIPPLIDENTNAKSKENDIKQENKKILEIHQTDKVRATPAARRLARLNNVELKNINGTGPRSRVQANDVLNYDLNKEHENYQHFIESGSELIPWTSMRKVIAENMLKSKKEIPHVVMTAEVDMTKVVQLRNYLLPLIQDETGERVSYLEIIAKATSHNLKRYPIFNSRSSDEGVFKYKEVNLGVAVALEQGLIVPVVKNADKKGLVELTTEIKALTKKARSNQLLKEEMNDATFTISSLGKSRVKHFTPIINYPEVAILGVGGIYEKQKIVEKDGQLAVLNIPIVELSLSFDHRVVDGAPASAFLSDLVATLEEPMSLLI
ncbi:2-oxo acid dehydrogenase subunit E2 [Vagococcus lutrae]|uniref:dihydrolipoamide acetyltransferase family protein n=1 Tax=Vagococcus lutrae TaxID=81947 RepID=UPI001C98264A|nr:dihydrolipoamide acetyltransferase family protein [Vagococcus lutrae]QZN88162.1 2-oxo acid dehydrogenase subunit E2 [Vagococcus lutrae]